MNNNALAWLMAYTMSTQHKQMDLQIFLDLPSVGFSAACCKRYRDFVVAHVKSSNRFSHIGRWIYFGIYPTQQVIYSCNL